jgi:hypothetical protein
MRCKSKSSFLNLIQKIYWRGLQFIDRVWWPRLYYSFVLDVRALIEKYPQFADLPEVKEIQFKISRDLDAIKTVGKTNKIQR